MAKTTDPEDLIRKQDRTLRRLVALLSLTQDMDRNEDDEEFVKFNDDAEIIYVFDQAIFEAFLRPSENHAAFGLFHTEPWSNQWRREEQSWRGISSQSTLIGAELLLTGQLPGQRNKSIYMSEWHFREFFIRYRAHRDELKTYIEDQERGDAYRESFLEEAKVLHDDESVSFDTKIQNIMQYAERSYCFKQDIERFQKSADATPSIAWRYALSRQAGALLANDDVFVRARKLDRLHSASFVERLMPIHTRFRPSTEKERQSLRDSWQDWKDRLVAEQARRQDAQGSDATRPRQSLENDAKSLAYLTWICAERLKPNQRIVFVTANHELLLNAYRLWHVEQPVGQPFLVRNATQYAPLLNLNAAPNDIHQASSLFAQTRSAVEVTLAPLNMAAPTWHGEQEVSERQQINFLQYRDNNRNYLAWLLAYTRSPTDVAALKHFLQAFTPDWVERRSKDFLALRKDWQQFERAAIGANYELLRNSLDALREAATKLDKASDSEEARDVFVTFLGDILDKITSQSIKLWFPLASDFVQAVPRRDQFQDKWSSRTPMALQLRLPRDARARAAAQRRVTQYDLITVIEKWIAGDPSASDEVVEITNWAVRTSRADLIFALAGTLALRIGHWSDADFFAELACSAGQVTQGLVSSDEDALENYHEYEYLRAISKRFQMGEMNPVTMRVERDVWKRELKEIISYLTESETFHRSRTDDFRDQTRCIRDLSERSAARIFYATWAIVWRADSGSPRQNRLSDWEDELIEARQELIRCLADLTGLATKQKESDDDPSNEVWNRLFKQVIDNLVAIHVIAQLAIKYKLTPRAEGLKLDANLVEDINSRITSLNDFISKDMPPATHVDLLAFKYVVSGDTEYRKQMRRVIKSGEQPRLQIDDQLFNLLLTLD